MIRVVLDTNVYASEPILVEYKELLLRKSYPFIAAEATLGGQRDEQHQGAWRIGIVAREDNHRVQNAGPVRRHIAS